MIDAANTVRPALEEFYASLNDEQKAKFNRLGRDTAQGRLRLVSRAAEGAALPPLFVPTRFSWRCDLRCIESHGGQCYVSGRLFWRIGSVSMWREYFDFAATALAVINGLIAITIALLPMRRSVLKLRLGAVALVLGALAVGATFYSKYRAYVRDRAAAVRSRRGPHAARELHRGRPDSARPDQGRRSRRCRRPPRTSGRSGRKSIFATSWASAPSPASARTRTSSTATTRRGRAAAGLLARGAQPRRQSGSDQRGIPRAAAAATVSTAAEIKKGGRAAALFH